MSKGRYDVVTAQTSQDIQSAQALRALAFGVKAPFDSDVFDDCQHHILVRDRRDGQLVCCFRIAVFEGADIKRSYAAQYYGLDRLAGFEGKMMELGRFCVHPDASDPDIVRIAWAALTRFVDSQDIKLLFGCTSFKGTDPQGFLGTFAVLARRHLAPPAWCPDEAADEVFRFADLAPTTVDSEYTMRQMPPLLRTYLLMGGWVSDHAVVDRQMNTLHVFTGLEIEAIPENRKRLLRGLV
ncbi:ornithine-acyl[acyl carrier protein] N-acyltransferase [Sulfitobacter marinus]|uniref:L-ornithine N(alpha)-acyltransferase n=2 Tax=Sulfitobacter marinus TaxID=394264 RepID=A0A1I6QXF0_9RHOB|nr:ornithine-acyl[acyl carrier protein] N-acyltransferase [Sulfitobacter marinus]